MTAEPKMEELLASIRKAINEDIGEPLLAQHLYSLLMFQRLALSNGGSAQG